MIAAFFMVVDHVGMLLFPGVLILRILGRLSFPIFAFMISEGCRYTKNKLRYFLTVFLSGGLMQTVFYLFSKSLNLNIFLTFSVSIILIYSADLLKSSVYEEGATRVKVILSFSAMIILLAAAFVASLLLDFDYGFFGFVTPLAASLFHKPRNAPEAFERLNTLPVSLLSMSVPLVLLAVSNVPIQFFSLLSLPILMLYSGERGRLRMKYFFYVFYPLHLLVIYAISLAV